MTSPGVHEDHADLSAREVRVEAQRLAHEVVDAGDGLDARRSRRPPRRTSAGGARMSAQHSVSASSSCVDHPVAERDRVAERLHRERALLEAREAEEVGDRARARSRGGRREARGVWPSAPCATTTAPALEVDRRRRRRRRTPTVGRSFRTGFTMWVTSRSLAATSCSIGVKRKKLSRLTIVTSTFGSCGRAARRARGRRTRRRSRRRR